MTYMSTTGQAPVPPGGPRGPLGPLLMTPGRWVALAVGVPVALALIGWTGFNLVTTVARGSYPFSYAIPVQDGHVAVNINAGDVTLQEAPGASTTARLTGTVQYGLIRPGISESITPTGANIGMSCDGINSNCGMSASLDVPARTAVTLWSNGGNVTASGFSSGMTVSAGGGNVTATNLAGNVQLDTGGGDLSANGLTGTLQLATEGGNVNADNWAGTGTTRVDTGGGEMTVNGLTGNFQMSTEGGNVDASGVASALIGMDSGGGNVTLALTQVPQNLQITTEGGNVTVILPLGSTTYDISTPDNQGANISYPQSLFSSTSTHKITIDSGGGNITVSQG
jgi:Putative adhesin